MLEEIQIDGNRIDEDNIDGNIVDTLELSGETGEVVVISDAPKYEGETEVTPKARESTTLETSGKMMVDNVLVLEIPYFETANESGTTVYIGG